MQLEYRTGSLRPQARTATTEAERERARQTVDDIRANPNMGPGPSGQGK